MSTYIITYMCSTYYHNPLFDGKGHWGEFAPHTTNQDGASSQEAQEEVRRYYQEECGYRVGELVRCKEYTNRPLEAVDD